jgi:hypothetical protein
MLHHTNILRSGSMCLVLLLWSLPAEAQSRRGAAPPPTRQLDQQAEQVQSDFLKGLAELANKYEEAGEVDKAREMLTSILKIKPDVESVKRKLKEFDESVFENNEVSVEVDVSRGWVNSGVAVVKDKPVRFKSEGSYRFIVNETVGPEGFGSQDPTRDMVQGVPAGGLVAMVAPASQSQGRNRNRSDDDREVVFLGADKEWTPKESGILFLKLNVPPNSKCIGKVKTTITGNFTRGR